MNISVGDRIKQRRLQLGIDADELATRIGKSRATVYRYENGDIENMPTTILEPLAKILNCSPAYLMGWDEEDSTIQNRDAVLEDIEKILSAEGYTLCCESYDDDYFLIKNTCGQTVIGFYDYELLPRYEFLKKKEMVTAKMLLSSPFSLCPVEKEHIEKYRALDQPGQDHVDTILQWETDRMEQLKQPANKQYTQTTGTVSIIEEPEPDYLAVNAAHAIEGADLEDIQHDEDIMNDDNEWK